MSDPQTQISDTLKCIINSSIADADFNPELFKTIMQEYAHKNNLPLDGILSDNDTNETTTTVNDILNAIVDHINNKEWSAHIDTTIQQINNAIIEDSVIDLEDELTISPGLNMS